MPVTNGIILILLLMCLPLEVRIVITGIISAGLIIIRSLEGHAGLQTASVDKVQ